MSLIKVEIKSANLSIRKFKDKAGNDRELRLQEGYVQLTAAYPERIEISLWDREPYLPGFYTLSPSAFQVSSYKNLELKRSLELVPFPTSKKPE